MHHILKCHEIHKTDFVRAHNATIYDVHGNTYLDFESGIWSAALGHNHPRITSVIQAQAAEVMHLGTRFPSPIADASALDVLEILRFKGGKCTFLSSGSEAVEFAVQAARRITGKPRLLTFASSYLSAYGSAGQKKQSEWAVLDWQSQDASDPAQLLANLDFESFGAFVFEPGGSGSGFVKFPPQALVSEIVHRVKACGGLIVANEITTGMGRTGKWFGHQHYDLVPDIAALGKGLGNGYPVSVAAFNPQAAVALEETHLHYAQSHQNDPLGCAVARAVIAEMQQGGWIERGRALGAHFLAGLQALQAKYPIVKAARGRGLLLALEFNPDPNLNAASIYHKLLEDGFLVGYYPAGSIIRFDPPLTIEASAVNNLLAALESILSSRE